jgi:hypothetical protein
MIEKWLNADPANVAVIHCVVRFSTHHQPSPLQPSYQMSYIYLLHSINRVEKVELEQSACAIYFSAEFAQRLKKPKNSSPKSDPPEKKVRNYSFNVHCVVSTAKSVFSGVTQPSQRRYIQYLRTVFLEDKYLNLQPIHLKNVVLTPMPTGRAFVLELYDSVCNGTLLYRHVHEPLPETAKPPLMNFMINLDVRGDMYFKVRHFRREYEYHNKKLTFLVLWACPGSL